MIEENEVPLVASPRMIGFYSAHGVGKTTLAVQGARWTWKEKKLRTRVMSLDPGSFEQYQQGIAQGYIDYMPADAWNNYAPDVLFSRVAEGWWPEDVSTPNSKLVPGYESLRICPACGGDSGSRGHAHLAQCASCKKALPSALPVTRRLTGLKGVGLFIAEGITKVGDTLLEAARQSRPGDRFYVSNDPAQQDLVRLANEALKKRNPDEQKADEKAALLEVKKRAETGEFSLAITAEQGHYFKAGQDLIKVLAASHRIPVPNVIWTAHEGRWEESLDKNNQNSPRKLMGLGPAMVPAKAMMSALRDFVVFGRVTVDETGKRFLQLDKHKGAESSTVAWQAKCNVLGARLPKALELPDPTKGNGFQVLIEALEKAREVELP